MKRLFLLAFLLTQAHAQAGELYRSIDSSGKVHYSDAPLSDAEAVEKLKPDTPPDPDEGLPYETRRAMENFPVTLYTFPECGSACQIAKEYLVKRGIPFVEKSLEKKEDIDAFRQASGDSKLPAATVGKTWLNGFLEERWSKELDFAGYPKTAPYRPRIAPKPAAPAQQPAEQPEKNSPAQ